ncbi:MAG TPA: cation diffusion facilitator family transporter [Galbitalea sp.]|jgi:cation diffusion facilitator family transporter
MSNSGGGRAIIAALLANVGIAIFKFAAFLASGSSSMLAESIHSLADTGNQLLLLLGGRQSRKSADEAHPFGYGRERFVYAFVVSIILFTVGGVFSIYEGIEKLTHPHPLENPWWPVAVLIGSIVLESFSFRTALRESRELRGGESIPQFIRHAKAPELPVIMLEDFAALIGLTLAFLGVGLTIITQNSVFDAIGTLCIGTLLVLVAVVLGIETKSLLVGEGATPSDLITIRDAINAHPDVEALIHIKTLYLGPDELLVGAKVAFARKQKLVDVAAAIDAVEAAIRDAVPIARVIYIEPDVYRPKGDGAARTESIIIKAAD